MLDGLLNALTIIGWIFFILFIGLMALRAFQYGGIREAVLVLTTKRAILSFLVALAITLVSASLVFIEPQEVGVVVSVISRSGYREQPLRSGLHWIVPLAERVVIYPISWQNYTMSNDPMEGEKAGDDSITARTSDGQVVYLDTSVIFKIDPNQVIRLHIELQNRYIDDFIRPVMRGIVRTEVSQFTADEVNSSKRKNLEANLEELLREAFDEKGFILDRFLLRNIAFSPQYASAIELKQVAEQEQV
ncbi:MAG TPA: prohibitin family protein, partial [Anaerolineales bacterium]|nr:prohibitin family protein [Anaerolineales bacterium]